MSSKPTVKIAPNNPLFDLPVLVGIDEGLFEKAGLDVSMSARYEDREKTLTEREVLIRLKEQHYECGRQIVTTFANGRVLTAWSAASAAATSRRYARVSRPRRS